MRPATRPRNILMGGGLLALLAGAAVSASPMKPISPRTLPAHVPTAAVLYRRAQKADGIYSYRGRRTITNWRNGHTVAEVLSHRAPNLYREDFTAPEGSRGKQVFRDGRQQWTYYPRRRELLHSLLARSGGTDANKVYVLLKSNYLVSVASQKQMWANRKVFLLIVTRRSNHTVARKFWIDAATGLILKWEAYNNSSRPTYTVAFSNITFHSGLTRAAFVPVRPSRRGVREGEERHTPGKAIPIPSVVKKLGRGWLIPPALAKYRLMRATVTPNQPPPLHLNYTDGLNFVILNEQRRTQTRMPTRVPHSRATRIGTVTGYLSSVGSINVISWDTATLNLSLVSAMPQRALIRLAAVVVDRHP